MTPPVASPSLRGPALLDRKLPLAVRVILLLLIAYVPTAYVVKQCRTPPGAAQMIFFGTQFIPRELPEVRQLRPAALSPYGYDGQFYAQVAIDPLLRHPQFAKALDEPAFRSQRIFLPALVYVLGGGRPAAILWIYAVINLAFWFLLLGGLVYFLRAVSSRHFLALAAVVLSAGALASIERALTDLPMATLGFFALALAGPASAMLMTASILTKPTGALFLLKHAWPPPRTRREVFARLLAGGIPLAVFGLWLLYIRHVFGQTLGTGDNLSWPLVDWCRYVEIDWHAWRQIPAELHWKEVTDSERQLVGLLALLSLMFQVVYLFARPELQSKYWRTGLAFALLFLCLNSFVEPMGFTRHVIPMALAFNVLLLRHKGLAYVFCFIAGNLGQMGEFHTMLVALLAH